MRDGDFIPVDTVDTPKIHKWPVKTTMSWIQLTRSGWRHMSWTSSLNSSWVGSVVAISEVHGWRTDPPGWLTQNISFVKLSVLESSNRRWALWSYLNLSRGVLSLPSLGWHFSRMPPIDISVSKVAEDLNMQSTNKSIIGHPTYGPQYFTKYLIIWLRHKPNIVFSPDTLQSAKPDSPGRLGESTI